MLKTRTNLSEFFAVENEAPNKTEIEPDLFGLRSRFQHAAAAAAADAVFKRIFKFVADGIRVCHDSCSSLRPLLSLR